MTAGPPSVPSSTVPFEVDDEVRQIAAAAAPLGLCRECFGRLFGRIGRGLTNPERAEKVRTAVSLTFEPTMRLCPICEGAFERLDVWVDRCLRATGDREFHRFACGSRWEPERLAREEAIWAETKATHGESVRAAFNRELGKRVAARSGAEGAPADPEIVMLADLTTGRVELTVLPVCVKGRYRKLDRTLPQTHWPCRRCRGLGCDTCGGTGKTYPTSVEEIIAAPFLRASGGTESRFHGMGREDIDARMLGEGRPFVLEILQPRRRSLDLPAIENELAREGNGRVEVLALTLTDHAEIARVKEASPTKSYRVDVRGEAPEDKVKEALAFVAGRAIAQRTPTRVAHRRSDRIRMRRILEARLVSAEAGRFTLELRTEAGTYVKEWVEGDGGRTEPSLAQLLGTPLKVDALDVLNVHDSPE